MNNSFILGEIEKWRMEEIITPEQARTLTARYSAKTKKSPYLIIFAVLGALMITAGAVLIIATCWTDIPVQIKSAMAFIPLAAAQITALYTVLKQKTSSLWREGLSVFYTAAVFGTVKLCEYAFSIPDNYTRYIFLCGMMLIPVFIVFRSVIASFGYLFAVLNWGAVSTDPEEFGITACLYFAAAAALTAFGVLHLLLTTKNAESLTKTAAHWVSAAAVFALVIIFAEMTDANIPLILLLMFNILLCSGKPSDRMVSPFVSAGTAGTFVMMLLISFGSFFEFEPEDKNAATFITVLILEAILCVVSAVNIRDLRRITITVSNSVIALLSLGAIAVTTEERTAYAVCYISLAAVLICGVIYMADGIKTAKLSEINTGLITTAVALSELISKADPGTFIKGIFFFAAGCTLLAVNFITIKKNRKYQYPTVRETEQAKEAAPNEIQ